jgi:hypothetical protein
MDYIANHRILSFCCWFTALFIIIN